MHLCIFSYNRGVFLKNCIDSIEQCIPQSNLFIFDDNSDDSDTCEILRSLSSKYQVITPSQSDVGQSKHGGLYANMQQAFSRFNSEDIVCFIQDDMQVVRAVGESEIEVITSLFQKNPTLGFVQPAFLKGCDKPEHQSTVRYDPKIDMYYIDRFNRSAGASYSDVSIFSIDNLRKVNWNFQSREAHNEQQARDKLTQMPYLKNPFLAWLPAVPAFRGKLQTVAIRLAHSIRKCDFYPYRIMSDGEVEQFINRDALQLPYAEGFLKLIDSTALREPWFYHPLQQQRVLKWLNSVELAVRRQL